MSDTARVDGTVFNGQRLHWSRVNLNGDTITARCSHTATLVDDSLLIFGGYGAGSDQHDSYYVNTSTFECHTVVPKCWSGPASLARVGHSACRLGQHIYVFGGWSGQSYCKTSVVYDFGAIVLAYQENKEQTSPAPRRDHACAVLGDTIYLFGGWNSVQQFNDVWTLNQCWRWSPLHCSGTYPIARRGQSANAIGTYILVFGGIHGLTYYLGDLHILDTSTAVWSQIPLTGDAPSPRAWHTGTVVGKYLFIIGGTAGKKHFYNDVHVLDTQTMFWHQVETSGVSPEERASHSATLIKDDIVIFGGITPSVLENTIFPLGNAFRLNVNAALVDSSGFTHETMLGPFNAETTG